MFIKYQHVVRLGTQEVHGIEDGECYVFPKIDGTNGCVWREDGEIHYGSRRRHLVDGEDNAGFKNDLTNDGRVNMFFMKYPNLRLYGEWLVPHSLNTYRETAWRRFYVFDVCTVNADGGLDYMHYEEYKLLLDDCMIEYIPPIAIVQNGTFERFIEQTKKNNFLIEDGKGVGEGIVIKRYGFKNKYNRTCWAKIVTSEFKEVHTKTMGVSVIKEKSLVEENIVEHFCTEALIEKTYAKIVTEEDGWSTKFIPRLLTTVYYDLVTEECWNFVKATKHPTINFKKLEHFVINKVKQIKSELF